MGRLLGAWSESTHWRRTHRPAVGSVLCGGGVKAWGSREDGVFYTLTSVVPLAKGQKQQPQTLGKVEAEK